MKYKSLPHKPLESPTPSPSEQLPKGISPKLLLAISELGQATSRQLAHWLSLNPDYVRQMLKLLAPTKDGPGGLVAVLHATSRKDQRLGSVPPLYTLNARGREYVRRQGVSLPERFKESELVGSPHTIAVNHVLVGAKVLERQEGSWLTFSDFRHESCFRRYPLTVKMSPGQTVFLKPDLWLDFRGRTAGRYCFCVEVNLREVTEKVWREKVRSYLACIPAYRDMFGTGIIQVVVICATRENFPKRQSVYPTRLAARAVRSPQAEERWSRLKNLIAWTEKELLAQNAKHEADMFLFTSFALDRATPRQLFLNQNFLMPFTPYTYPLIKRKEGKAHA